MRQDRSIRLHFSSAIFQASVFLEARILNRTTDVALPQSVEAGDARADVGSNSVQIVASDVEVEILGPMKLSSSVFTPNGDEINEDAQVSFDLFSVNEARPRGGARSAGKNRNAVGTTGDCRPLQHGWDGRNGGGRAPAFTYPRQSTSTRAYSANKFIEHGHKRPCVKTPQSSFIMRIY